MPGTWVEIKRQRIEHFALGVRGPFQVVQQVGDGVELLGHGGHKHWENQANIYPAALDCLSN